MNTPKPCDTCDHLYVDCVTEDFPGDEAECKLGLPLGDIHCLRYKDYKENLPKPLSQLRHNLESVMESLRLKFISGNSIEVERSNITREEYEVICEFVDKAQDDWYI